MRKVDIRAESAERLQIPPAFCRMCDHGLTRHKTCIDKKVYRKTCEITNSIGIPHKLRKWAEWRKIYWQCKLQGFEKTTEWNQPENETGTGRTLSGIPDFIGEVYGRPTFRIAYPIFGTKRIHRLQNLCSTHRIIERKSYFRTSKMGWRAKNW